VCVHDTGTGTKTWPDGRSYTGEFAMGREHGEGTMIWPDGAEHTGRFRCDTVSPCTLHTVALCKCDAKGF
jgi:hypothetical protein